MQEFINKKLKSANKAFLAWKQIDFKERQTLLENLSKLLLEEKLQHAKLMTKEMHKPISQSLAEIEKCAGMSHYYATLSPVLQKQKVQTEMKISEVHFEPMGVILGVMPWNYPFWQVLRFAIPTILAGNTVVIKHASICEKSGDAIEKLFKKAGFPKGVFTHLKIGHQEVEELIQDPIIKAVSLTGSEGAGRAIARAAGENLKKCVLELGGSDPFIVLEDADIKKAAKDAAAARLQNCGQTCVAAKRIIIHEKIYDKFMKLFVAAYAKYHSEDPESKDTVMGIMARADLASDLQRQYKAALKDGAKIISPLQKIGKMGFEPGLIEVNPGNPIVNEELFGPLGMVFKAKNDKEALRIANETMFGLASAVYTKSKKKAQFFAAELEVGSVAINQIFRSDWRMPFGGRKNSGYGVELSEATLHEFTIRKSVIGSV